MTARSTLGYHTNITRRHERVRPGSANSAGAVPSIIRPIRPCAGYSIPSTRQRFRSSSPTRSARRSAWRPPRPATRPASPPRPPSTRAEPDELKHPRNFSNSTKPNRVGPRLPATCPNSSPTSVQCSIRAHRHRSSAPRASYPRTTTRPCPRRLGSTVGVLLADLDHFKQLNNTHGHIAGDQILRAVADALKHSVRGYDLIGRHRPDRSRRRTRPRLDLPPMPRQGHRLPHGHLHRRPRAPDPGRGRRARPRRPARPVRHGHHPPVKPTRPRHRAPRGSTRPEPAEQPVSQRSEVQSKSSPSPSPSPSASGPPSSYRPGNRRGFGPSPVVLAQPGLPPIAARLSASSEAVRAISASGPPS